MKFSIENLNRRIVAAEVSLYIKTLKWAKLLQTILKFLVVRDEKGGVAGIEFFVWYVILKVEEERGFPPMQ